MDTGSLVWVHDPADPLVWVPAQVLTVHRTLSTEPSAVTVQLVASGRTVDIPLSVTSPSGECHNVLLQNQPHELDQSDLVALPHLHEAAILHALRLRYARDAIYTRIGEILISINPFKRLPTLYTRETVAQYAPVDQADIPPPHLFAIARAAYVDVVRNGRNQSILISGESGAGKTEATKIMMKYFAETCGTTATIIDAPAATATATSATFSIETQVLQSNPILEAFGNARTVRNDNSSRFGKFIELQFDATPRHAIVGARIRTYLLEKIRVVSQAPHERNFHVFYELLAVASSSSSSTSSSSPPAIAAAAPAWKLRTAADFRLLNQSGCFARRDGVDDATQFLRTHRAMQQIGLRDDEIVDVFSVVAALLHLGNVAFAERLQSSSATREALVAAGNEPFGTAALLLRVAPETLAFALTKRTLTTATETLTVALDATQAEHTRNALVMEAYRLLFAWLVGKVNSKIHYTSTTDRVDCIGLLDIFGFEDMAVNSFEQLCINYANEALQHQFNAFVFDEEQKLYASEGIAWAFVDFPNNKACLELFEKRPLGLFSLADQECLFPQGTDRALLAKLYTEFEKKTPHAHFAPPPSGWQRQSHFVVAHYAGRVSYAVDGFLAKNKDAFCETAAALLATSRNALVQSLSLAAAEPATEAVPPAVSVSRPGKSTKSALAAVSVGTQFKLQLNDLLDRIRATAPHYVRCIKPNDGSASDRVESARVLEQLRCGGVLEAVRVARAGFPVRMSHTQFLERYARVLRYRTMAAMSLPLSLPLLEQCLARLADCVPGAATTVSLGRTRVFFRREPYEQIERLRRETLTLAATRLQTIQRCANVRRAYCRLRHAVLLLQAQFRGVTARARVTALRQTRCATLLQRATRRWLALRRYTRFRTSVLACQSHWRRRWATRQVAAMRADRAAQRIATFWRCHRARRQFVSLRRSTLALQCALRQRVAKKALVALRVESRNVSKLQQDNLKLQTELATLRMALLTMQAQNGHTAFPGFQIPIEPEVARTLQLPKPSLLLRSLDAPFANKTAPSPQDNQPQTTTPPAETVKPRSQLTVDLSNESSPSRVNLQAPHSVVPPSSTAVAMTGSYRRSSMELPSSSSGSSAASSSKAELFAQMQRRRSRSSQHLGAGPQRWQNQQDALDAKVKQLREELKAAARAANPEEEQDEIVKRFVAAQLQLAAIASPSPRHSPLQPRHSGGFGLALPDECDNNSAVDDAEPQEQPLRQADDDPRTTPVAYDPTASMASSAHFKRRSSSNLMAPPLTACAPHSRFAWGTAALTAGSNGTEAPLSARPASYTHGLATAPRFFGDSRASTPRDAGEHSAWSSSVFSGSVTSLGSVPRWCKADECRACRCKFTFLTRRHHCRSCGNSFCFEHSTRRLLLTELGYAEPQRVCDDCFEVRAIEASRASHVSHAFAFDNGAENRMLRMASSLSLASTVRDSESVTA